MHIVTKPQILIMKMILRKLIFWGELRILVVDVGGVVNGV